MAEKLWSTTELGEALGISRQYANRLIDRDRFPNAQLVGTSYAVPHSDVVNYIKARIEEAEKDLAFWRSVCKNVESGEEEA